MPTLAAFIWGNYGRLISKKPCAAFVCITVVVANIALIGASNMWSVPLATEISKLWIDPNSQVAANNGLVEEYGNKIEDGNPELVTLSAHGLNMASSEGMQLWTKFMNLALDTVYYDEITNSTYTILDICNGRNGQVPYAFGCSIINPLDYFKEGGKFFPADAAAQWLLETRLAYPFVQNGQCTSTSCKQALWTWAMSADLASRAISGEVDFYLPWFQAACVISGKALCGDADNLVAKANSLIQTAEFPLAGKLQFAWIKSSLVLGTMLQGIGVYSAGSCKGSLLDVQESSDTGIIALPLPIATALESMGFENGQTYSMANCARNLDQTPCGGDIIANCSATALATTSLLNFTSPCATCILATMWWTGDMAHVFSPLIPGIKPSSDAPSTGALGAEYPPGSASFPFKIWNTALPEAGNAVANGLFKNGIIGTQTQLAGTTCLEDIANVPKPSTCETLFNEFYNLAIAGAESNSTAALATVGPRVAALVADPVDPLVALQTYNGGKERMDALWRELLAFTPAIPNVQSVLRRHESRPSVVSSDDVIRVALSGSNNDLPTQNLRPAMFGGASPHPLDLVPGRCECNDTPENPAGATCALTADPICDCGFMPTRQTCVNALLDSCASMAYCAGYGTIKTLVDNGEAFNLPSGLINSYKNFENEVLIGASLQSSVAAVKDNTVAAFVGQCFRAIPCAHAYDYDSDDELSGFATSDYIDIAKESAWNIPLLLDISSLEPQLYNYRSILLAQMCYATASFGTCVTQLSDLLTALTLGSYDPTAAPFNCLMDPTGWDNCARDAAGDTGVVIGSVAGTAGAHCPVTVNSLLGEATENLSVQQFYRCAAEFLQPFDILNTSPFTSPTAKLGAILGAFSLAAPTVCNSPFQDVGITKDNCTHALPVFLWQGVETIIGSNVSADAVHQAFGLTPPATRPNALQQGAASTYLVKLLASNPGFVAAVNTTAWGGCASYETCPLVKAHADALLAAQCEASGQPPLFVERRIEAPACKTLLQNILAVLSPTPDPVAVATAGKALAKYKFAGTINGVCGADGITRGGAECWSDNECGGSTGRGVCKNLTNAVPFTNITSLAFILQTNDPEGTVSFMRRFESRYRRRANAPILERYIERLANQTGRRLSTLELGHLDANISLTLEDADRIITNWRRELIKNVRAFRDLEPSASANVYTSSSASDLLGEVSNADAKMLILGYGLMLLYTLLSCTNWSTDVQAMVNGSRALVGMVGVILVAISVASGLGVSHMLKVEWSAVATQIVPFVMLGLGVSDTFVMLRIWPYYRDGLSAEDAAANALTIAGPPMLLVSVTNAGVFAVGVLTGMPVVVNFALQAVIVVIANYFTTNLMLPALLVLDYKRMAAGRADLAPCVKVGVSARGQVTAQDTGYEQNVFNRICTPTYAKILLSVPGKLFILAWGIAFLGSSIYGVTEYSELGLQLSDVAPKDSDVSQALATRDSQFGFYTVGIVTSNADWSLREVQQGLVHVFNKVMALDNVVDGSGIPWIQVFMTWGVEDTPTYNTETNGAICDINNSRTSGKCGKVFNCLVVTEHESILNGSIPFYSRADFKRCLSHWVQNDLGYEGIKPSFPLEDPYAPRSQRKVLFGESDDPLAAFLPFTRGTLFAQNLRENADYVQLINEIRAVANSDTTPPTFPIGEPLDFWDQYVNLRNIINKAVGYGLLIVFVTTWIFLLALVEGDAGLPKRVFATFWGAAVNTGVIALIVYEIYGYLAFAGLKISAIPAISIIMSTGVAVEYTSYIAVAFVNAAGSHNERARHSLMLMMAPVVDGGITMLLGVIMLSASPFTFVVKYFFYPWLLIVFFGLFNGVAFLPVLLSLVGPPSVKSSAKTEEALTTKA